MELAHIVRRIGAVNVMHNRSARYTAVAAVTVTVLVFGILGTQPAVRGMIESTWQRFGLAFVDTDDSHTDVVSPLVVELEPTFGTPPLSTNEIQQQFPLARVPTWLPEGLQLTGGSVSELPEDARVSLDFHLVGESIGSTPVLRLAVGPDVSSQLSAPSEQAVEVNGFPATYVHGIWRGDDQGVMRFDDLEDNAWLWWEEEGLSYMLSASGMNLELDDMLRIAESLE